MKTDSPSSSNERAQLPRDETVAAALLKSSNEGPPPTEGFNPQAATGSGLPDLLPASFGRYQLLKLLGQGGMGAVYLARDTQLDRLVALKVPRFSAADGPLGLERFLREARAAAALHHANICPVFDVGEIDGVHYLTMAYLEGRSLADVLRGNKNPIPSRQAAALVRQLALALAEAHRHRVIHRDLKPANIMLGKQDEPVVMDFGLARRGGSQDAHLTHQGDIMGTPAYMAPEQAKGALDEMGPGCDIYSLGVILYQLLTRRLPFTGDTVAILAQLLTDAPQPPSHHRPEIDAAIESICLKAMAKKPGDRFASMTDFAAALTDYLNSPDQTWVTEANLSHPVEDVPVMVSLVPLPSEPRRGRWVVGLGLVGVIVLLAGGAAALYALRDHRPLEDERRIAPAEVKADAPVPYAWPAEALRDGKIPAPDLSRVNPLLHDTFANPTSGFARDKANAGHKGYRAGKYFIAAPGHRVFWWAVPMDRAKPAPPEGDFACQLVGQASGEQARWGLGLGERAEAQVRQLLWIDLDVNGKLRVRAALRSEEKISRFEIVSHTAIKSGQQTPNTLLVVVRGRQLEIYVNAVAVCNPLLLERNLTPPHLALLGVGGAEGGTAEFESITLWPTDTIPSLESRGAAPQR